MTSVFGVDLQSQGAMAGFTFSIFLHKKALSLASQ
jgi:hypothetical protein